MAGVTQVLLIRVGVRPAFPEGHDVIDDSRDADDAALFAVSAERIAGQVAGAIDNTAPTPDALYKDRLDRRARGCGNTRTDACELRSCHANPLETQKARRSEPLLRRQRLPHSEAVGAAYTRPGGVTLT